MSLPREFPPKASEAKSSLSNAVETVFLTHTQIHNVVISVPYASPSGALFDRTRSYPVTQPIQRHLCAEVKICGIRKCLYINPKALGDSERQRSESRDIQLLCPRAQILEHVAFGENRIAKAVSVVAVEAESVDL